MVNADFNNLLVDIQSHQQRTFIVKGKEYGSQDRLHNFKEVARRRKITPAQALIGMFEKHLQSIYDMVDADQAVDPELAREKCGDARNYLVLLEAIFRDEQDYQESRRTVMSAIDAVDSRVGGSPIPLLVNGWTEQAINDINGHPKGSI